jgi:flavin-dependent dehydrogenase
MHNECMTRTQYVAIVGASFAGLARAIALTRAGRTVTVLERKDDPGAKPSTTGIFVKDAIDTVPLLDAMPAAIVRRVAGVRL